MTLIEILIVMVIISIVAGVAVVTITQNQHRDFTLLAKQLANTVALAEEEAMLKPATLGLAFTPDTFQFYRFERDPKTKKNSWQPIEAGPLKLKHLPPKTTLTIKVLDKTIPKDGKPHIIISSGGDLVPFTILIGKTADNPYYQITGNANGEVTSAIYHSE
jgi:general secretion pathway protein H